MSRSGGLRGDFAGSCVVCLRGTDTGAATEGESEWHAAFLVALGVPRDEALDTVRYATGSDPGMVQAGRFTVFHRVCVSCAQAMPDVVPTLMLPGLPVPTWVQPEDVTYDEDES